MSGRRSSATIEPTVLCRYWALRKLLFYFRSYHNDLSVATATDRA